MGGEVDDPGPHKLKGILDLANSVYSPTQVITVIRLRLIDKRCT